MRGRWFLSLILGLFLVLLGGVGLTHGAINEYAPGEVLVKFTGMHATEALVTLRGEHAESFAARLPAMAQEALSRVQGKAIRAFPRIGVLQVKLPGHISVEEAIVKFKESNAVEFAEPNYIVHAAQTQTLPNDPNFAKQWGLNNTGQSFGVKDADIDAPEAWYLKGTDSSGVILVVIDTGVDYNHPDLKANIWHNPWPGNFGYINDLYGINAITGSGDPKDDNGHGTHCAGIAGAAGNNGTGVSGVAWKAQIMALKFLNSAGSGYEADGIECITYALAVKEQYNSQNLFPRFVMSSSWGGDPASNSMLTTLQEVLNQGVLFVAAAGNNGRNMDTYPFYPASYGAAPYNLPNVISVGASDNRDNRAYFSNYGAKSVDLFAPGNNIYSTLPNSSYGNKSGTSMACPFVSGACALVWTYNLALDYQGIKDRINKVDQKSAFSGKCVSGGRLNLYNAIQ